MTREDYIKREMSIWGEDCVNDLFDSGYDVVELVVFGELRWWWILGDATLINRYTGDFDVLQLLRTVHVAGNNSMCVLPTNSGSFPLMTAQAA